VTEKDLENGGIVITRNSYMKKAAPSVPSKSPSSDAPERKIYPAKCATCEADIEVPFKPDGTRPTFCKECLKDYQRQQARVQQTREARGVQKSAGKPALRKTISMRDAVNMQPKNFRRENPRSRKKVDLEGVRSLIKESLDSK